MGLEERYAGMFANKQFNTKYIMKKIQLGSQLWMSNNLDVVQFRNGDVIAEAKSSEDWKKGNQSKTPMWCYYEFDSANGAKYGKFYNWFAVSDSRGLAPDGYVIPNDSDWDELMSFISEDNGLDSVDEVSGYLKGGAIWEGDRNEGDHYGYNAEPCGKVDMFGNGERAGECGYWWSASEDGEGGGQFLAGNPDFARYRAIHECIGIGKMNKMCGLSVRCMAVAR